MTASFIDAFFAHRVWQDVGLIYQQFAWYQWAGLALAGFGLGMVVAHQLWHFPAVNAKTHPHSSEPDSRPSPLIRIEPVLSALSGEGAPNQRARREARPEPVMMITPDSKRPFGTGEKTDDDRSGPVPVQRIAYIMDVSHSLSEKQFRLCKEELIHALEQLPDSFYYQVIFFSGPTWFAHQKMIEGGAQGEAVTFEDEGSRFRWKYEFGGYRYSAGNHKLPEGEWRAAQSTHIAESLRHIQSVTKSYGTTWHLPFMLAMNLDPCPDHIYFLTDGLTAHQNLVAEGIVDMVKRRGGQTTIHTNALMIPAATTPLRYIAEKTGGEYSLVKFEAA